MILLFCIKVFSQDLYCDYRVVTWEKIIGFEYSNIGSDYDTVIIRLESTGEIVIVEYND